MFSRKRNFSLAFIFLKLLMPMLRHLIWGQVDNQDTLLCRCRSIKLLNGIACNGYIIFFKHFAIEKRVLLV